MAEMYFAATAAMIGFGVAQAPTCWTVVPETTR
jgi:hypothetical protein